MLVIKRLNGQYWTGTCWGVEQGAMTYDAADELPEEIEGAELEGNLAGDLSYYDGDGCVAEVRHC